MRRDLTAIYKQRILGPLWFVIAPLATTIVFTVIFGKVAKISTDGLPPFLYLYEQHGTLELLSRVYEWCF